MAKTEIDIAGRLAFLGIDETIFTVLGTLWLHIEPEIDDICGRYLAHMMSVPHLREKWRNVDFDKLKHRLPGQWREIFTKGITENLVQRVAERGFNFHRDGFEPRWFLGSYAVGFDGFEKIAIRVYRDHPKELTAAISALGKIEILITDIMVSAYYEASRIAAQAELDRHAEVFETGVMATVQTVAAATEQVRQVTREMFEAANQTNALSSAVTQASNKASENVHGVATASEEMVASVAEVNNQLSRAAKATNAAANQASGSTESTESLIEASERIGNVSELISDIASQTNLLALNATIEAARAGDAGRGFAVVASEVKSLAGQTAKATSDISAQIDAIQVATRQVVAANSKIEGSIDNIKTVAGSIYSSVQQQGAAADEISRNIQMAAMGTQEVSEGTGEVDNASRRTSNAAQAVLQATEDITGKVETLNSQVGDFIKAVRSE
ncbi:MAG: methyl-accepting chemotaxis protein [Sphingomonadales bacterium]